MNATSHRQSTCRRNEIAPIVSTIEVHRSPDDVFAYVTDPSRFSEWQKNVVGGHLDGARPPSVGTKCVTRRRIGFAERPVTSELTALSPPTRWAVHGIDGPIRATVNVTVEPSSADPRSRVTIAIDFEGHGIGRLMVPLVVRREAQKEMLKNLRRPCADSRSDSRPRSHRRLAVNRGRPCSRWGNSHAWEHRPSRTRWLGRLADGRSRPASQ